MSAITDLLAKLQANGVEFASLVSQLQALNPVVVPPATTNTYISATHPGPNTPPSLVSTDKGGPLKWGMFGIDAATGMTKFWANGTTQTQVLGSKLVLQDDNVYAKQPDGSWKMGTRFGPVTVPATTVVVDPEGA